MARPALTEPPGELMYRLMSLCASSAASSTSSAQIRLAMSSSTCWPRNTIRCRSSRWKSWSPSGSSGASAVRARISATCPSLGVTPAMPSLMTASACRAASLTVPLLVSALCRAMPTVLSRPCCRRRRPFRRVSPLAAVPVFTGPLTVTLTLARTSIVPGGGLFAVGAGHQSVLGGVFFPAAVGGLGSAVFGGVVTFRGGGLDVHRPARLVGDLHPLGEQPQRLAVQHLRHGHGQLAPVHDLLGQPVRRYAQTVGLLHDVGVQLFLLHPQVFGAGQLVEHKAGLHRPARVGGDLRLQVKLGDTARLQVGLPGGAGPLQLLVQRP